MDHDHDDDGKYSEVRTDGYTSGKPSYDHKRIDPLPGNTGCFIRDDQAEYECIYRSTCWILKQQVCSIFTKAGSRAYHEEDLAGIIM